MTAFDADAVHARTAQIRARQKEIDALIEQLRAEQRALGEEAMALGNQTVESWGPNPTAEQLLSLGGTQAATKIVDARVESMARGHYIRRAGFTVVPDGKQFRPTGFAFDAWLATDTDTADLAAALVAIAEEFRTGRTEVPFNLHYRSGTDEGLDVGLDNGKIRHTITITDADHAEGTETWSSRTTSFATGTPAEVLAAAIERAHSDKVGTW